MGTLTPVEGIDIAYQLSNEIDGLPEGVVVFIWMVGRPRWRWVLEMLQNHAQTYDYANSL